MDLAAVTDPPPSPSAGLYLPSPHSLPLPEEAEDDDVEGGPRRLLAPAQSARLRIAGSILLYWLSVSAIPTYNKYCFRKANFPFPVATAGIQLGLVAAALLAASAARGAGYFLAARRAAAVRRKAEAGGLQPLLGQARRTGTGTRRRERSEPPGFLWIGGPHFLYKLQWCLPIGVAFGLKYAVTNLGLSLIDTQTHLLLQSTDIVWTLLFARTVTGEAIAGPEVLAAAASVAGSALLAVRLDEEAHRRPWFPILVNLTSPALLGLSLATLRLACDRLMHAAGRVSSPLPAPLGPGELTGIKLAVSATVAFACSVLVEGVWHINGRSDEDWWMAWGRLVASGSPVPLAVCGGAAIILVFQVNITFLTALTSAATVGMVGQAKVLPQWAAASAFALKPKALRPLNVAGAALCLGSAVLYTAFKYRRLPA